MCYSNIIMDKDSIETPPTPQGATPPQSEVPQSQDEAVKPQDSTAKRRWLARFVDRLTWWQATAIIASIFALPPVAVAGVIDKGVPLNGFFGIYNGSSFDTIIFILCLLVTPPLSPLCALMFATYFATRRKDLATLKRMMPVALIACIFLAALLSTLLGS